jgi:hypothetical protein
MSIVRTALEVLACAALVVVTPALARAQAPAPTTPPAAIPVQPAARPVSFIFGMGFDRGSEELAKVELSDGSTQTLRANEGFYFEAGLAFLRVPVSPASTLETAATIGWKGWNVGADNGSINYRAFPLEVVERITYEQVRLGLGLSFLLSPKLSTDGVLSEYEFKELKNSLGVVLQADWIGKRVPGGFGFFLGGRFVWQKLEPTDGSGSVNANAIGIRLGFEY